MASTVSATTGGTPRLDSAQINLLSERLADRLDEMLGALGADLRGVGSRRVGPCPVHGGDNPTACKMWTDGYSQAGNWVCHSRHCEEIFLPTLLGFVRGVLSAQSGWARPGDPPLPFFRAVQWSLTFLGLTPQDLQVDAGEEERHQYLRRMTRLGREVDIPLGGWTRAQTRSFLTIPSPYFQSRGFPGELLDQLDVGDSRAPAGHPMSGRGCVPLYDPLGRRVQGVTARSVHPQCASCLTYHPPDQTCPATRAGREWWSKWKVSRGVNPAGLLYHFHQARASIERDRLVVLTEGPLDVWRLLQANVPQAVGLLGCEVEDGQQILLEGTPILDVVLLLDQDEAGQKGTERALRKLGRLYRMHTPRLDLGGKDVGGADPRRLEDQIQPLLEKIKRR